MSYCSARDCKIIDGLDIHKSTGPYGIPIFLLKTYKAFFSHLLSKLVNVCFEKGIFPEILKTAKVIPLHKKDSKLHHLNYRPISPFSVKYTKNLSTQEYTHI